MAWNNIIGKQFGDLIVIDQDFDYIVPSTGRHVPRWVCKCIKKDENGNECGNTITVINNDLINGHTHCCAKCKSNAFKDITGQKFGSLTAVKRGPDYIWNGEREVQWICDCDCGVKGVIVKGNFLRNGHTKSCGCANIKHGLRNTKIYSIYNGIKSRCGYFAADSAPHYKEKGIKICDEWLGEYGFVHFYRWALDAGWDEEEEQRKAREDRPNRLTVDRIDNNGDYSPENCRLATPKEQAYNRDNTVYLTDSNGETHHLYGWSLINNVPTAVMARRMRSGWDVDRIVHTPVTYIGTKVKIGQYKYTLEECEYISGVPRDIIYKRIHIYRWDSIIAVFTPFQSISINGVYFLNEYDRPAQPPEDMRTYKPGVIFMEN